ncbi:ABC transporter permease [Macrococcus hajekii]|uniref:ABC transporter permease n=1 Tax=Macrococcus hajekii TaxID=198482 RepID=A0A4R6BJ75_9STAP|nr:ABC transporter permease [Macrococcus hajekii]TDM01697.1 ABC transporter permease [Macrococcus hajekii]GGB06664.1 antibiotic ABC transporter permease [Macrococcus hajekii]
MRILGLTQRLLTEQLRDKRTLALLIIAPILILTLFYFVFTSAEPTAKLGAVNMEASVIDTIESQDIDVTKLKTPDQTLLKDEKLDGIAEKKGDAITLTLLNDDVSIARKLELVVNQTYQKKAQITVIDDMKAKFKDLTKTLNKIPFSPTKNIQFDEPKKTDITVKYIYGNEDTTLFNTFAPLLIGFFVFLFVFLLAGMGFLKERMTGTLERMLTTPVKRYEIVLGYVLGFGILAVLQTIAIVFYAVYVLKLGPPESIGSVIIINIAIAFVALSLGLLLSAFAKSEFQMMQFIPLVIVPQIFLSGLFPLDSLARWIQSLAFLTPLYYAGDALKGVMYKRLALGEVTLDIVVLLLFATLFLALNILALRKYRTL